MHKISITKLFNTLVLLFLICIFTAACSKQDEAQTPPGTADSTAAMPDSGSSSDSTPEAQTGNAQMEEAASGQATTEATTGTEATADAPAETASTAPSTTDTTTTDATTPASSTPAPTAANGDQLALAKKSGCLACHAVDKKIIGPAWRDVSRRYKDDPGAKARLTAKVAKGGSGNWKDVVGAASMPPYSPRVSNENIAKLVDFVLSLEK